MHVPHLYSVQDPGWRRDEAQGSQSGALQELTHQLENEVPKPAAGGGGRRRLHEVTGNTWVSDGA